MGSSPPAPPAPTPPAETAAAQTGSNVFSGQTNQYGGQVNVDTPFGSVDYEQDASKDFTDPNSGKTYTIPHYKQTMEFSPEGQQMYEATTGTGIEAGRQAKSLLEQADYSQYPTDIGDRTSGLMGEWLGRQRAWQAPLDNQQRDRQRTQLLNSGLSEESTAYKSRMRDLEDQLGRNQSAAEQGYEGTAYGRAKDNYLMPLSVVQGLTGLGTPVSPQMSQTPQSGFTNTPVNNVGINAAYDQARMQAYGYQQQNAASQNSAMAGIISPFARIFSGGFG